MRRAVIFDYGGVLMKTRDYGPRHAWDDQLGLAHGSVEKVVHGSESWFRVMRGQISLEAYWADVARQLHLDSGRMMQLATDFYAGDQLDQNMVDYIRHLRGQGHQVALLSNASVALVNELHSLQIASLFDPLVISSQIGVLKPAPAGYHTTLDGLRRLPDETIFVDDTPANIEGALALAIHAVRYVNEMDLPAALAPLLIVSAQ